MKKLKKCFGNKTKFFKENIEECKRCGFKQKCLLQTRGQLNEQGDKNDKNKM